MQGHAHPVVTASHKNCMWITSYVCHLINYRTKCKFLNCQIHHFVLSAWSVSWIIRYCNIVLVSRDIFGLSKAGYIDMRDPIRYASLAISGHVHVLTTKVYMLSAGTMTPLKTCCPLRYLYFWYQWFHTNIVDPMTSSAMTKTLEMSWCISGGGEGRIRGCGSLSLVYLLHIWLAMFEMVHVSLRHITYCCLYLLV